MYNKEDKEIKNVLIKCYKCLYEWEYKGNSIYFINCPRCRKALSKRKLMELNNNKVNTNE